MKDKIEFQVKNVAYSNYEERAGLFKNKKGPSFMCLYKDFLNRIMKSKKIITNRLKQPNRYKIL